MSEERVTASGFQLGTPKAMLGESAACLEKAWMLLTAGTPSTGLGTMTVNWGGFGYLWHRDLAFVVVRKSRHTLPRIEQTGMFSLSLFDEEDRPKLAYCGKVSGWQEDKIAHCAFTTAYELDIPYFTEARTVLLCRVMYGGNIEKAAFFDQKIVKEWYEEGVHKDDMHRFFCASIERVLHRP